MRPRVAERDRLGWRGVYAMSVWRAVLHDLSGFFRESTGKLSSTRFAIVLLVVVGAIVALSFSVLVLWKPEKINEAVVAGFGTVLGAVLLHGVVALSKKTPVTDDGTDKSGALSNQPDQP